MDGELSHEEVMLAGADFLITRNCQLILKEFHTAARERPDVFGYKSGQSYLVEAKTSRSDFRRDQKKHFRQRPKQGMGNKRYYACPEGLIEPDEVPDKWGLLHIGPMYGFELVKQAKNQGAKYRDEMKVLYSLLRRDAVTVDSDFDYLHGDGIGR